MMNMIPRYFCCLIFFILTACNQGLVINTAADLPTPLTNQYPLNVAVIYDDTLREYVYSEDSEDRQNWNISIGSSQVDLFNKILPPLFKSIEVLNSTNTINSTYDAIISPKLIEIQFALPIETQIDLYEVWVKYDIAIQDSEGNIITTLPLSGYGKTPIKFFIQDEEGIATAANQAYRDAGAKLILAFESNPRIKQWLASKGLK